MYRNGTNPSVLFVQQVLALKLEHNGFITNRVNATGCDQLAIVDHGGNPYPYGTTPFKSVHTHITSSVPVFLCAADEKLAINHIA